MANKDLKTKFETLTSTQLMKWLAYIVAFATALLFGGFFLYIMHFNGGFSSDQKDWGEFGAFVGGLLSPLMSFLALIALVLTIILQNKQLEISKNEMELSRKELETTIEELKRSAEAQERAERIQESQATALELSAKITAISHILKEIESELMKLPASYIAGSATEAQLNRANQTKKEFTDELKRLYDILRNKDKTQP